MFCKDGRREESETDEAIKHGDFCKPVPTPTPAVTQINPNAFNIWRDGWRDGRGFEILDYPQGHGVQSGNAILDGVFNVEIAGYWKPGKFRAVPTAGAKVVNDVPEYPMENGK